MHIVLLVALQGVLGRGLVPRGGPTASYRGRARVARRDALGTPEAKALIDTGAAVVDVRMEAEFRLEGHISGAACCPAQTWEHGFYLPRDEFVDDMTALHSFDEPLLLCCTDGRRSEMAAEQLREAGFSRVSSIYGGLTAWQEDYILEVDDDGEGGLVGSWV